MQLWFDVGPRQLQAKGTSGGPGRNVLSLGDNAGDQRRHVTATPSKELCRSALGERFCMPHGNRGSGVAWGISSLSTHTLCEDMTRPQQQKGLQVALIGEDQS